MSKTHEEFIETALGSIVTMLAALVNNEGGGVEKDNLLVELKELRKIRKEKEAP